MLRQQTHEPLFRFSHRDSSVLLPGDTGAAQSFPPVREKHPASPAGPRAGTNAAGGGKRTPIALGPLSQGKTKPHAFDHEEPRRVGLTAYPHTCGSPAGSEIRDTEHNTVKAVLWSPGNPGLGPRIVMDTSDTAFPINILSGQMCHERESPRPCCRGREREHCR